jgi:hypothetical protein
MLERKLLTVVLSLVGCIFSVLKPPRASLTRCGVKIVGIGDLKARNCLRTTSIKPEARVRKGDRGRGTVFSRTVVDPVDTV